MSILGFKEKKVSYTYKMPQWFYDALVRAAKGDNLNTYITDKLLAADPSLRKPENAGFKKLMEGVKR